MQSHTVTIYIELNLICLQWRRISLCEWKLIKLMSFAMAMYRHSLHKTNCHCNTTSLCAALLCISQSLSQLAQEHNLPDLAMSSSAVSFKNLVCIRCYDWIPIFTCTGLSPAARPSPGKQYCISYPTQLHGMRHSTVSSYVSGNVNIWSLMIMIWRTMWRTIWRYDSMISYNIDVNTPYRASVR
jgi:hypothetical protein